MTNEEKNYRAMKCLERWLCCTEQGKSISEFCKELGYKHVAIYGYASLGKHLLRDFKKNNNEVEWVMDKRKANDCEYNSIVHPSEINNIPAADLIIIASVSYVEEIEKFLRENVEGVIVSIEELLDTLYFWEM